MRLQTSGHTPGVHQDTASCSAGWGDRSGEGSVQRHDMTSHSRPNGRRRRFVLGAVGQAAHRTVTLLSSECGTCSAICPPHRAAKDAMTDSAAYCGRVSRRLRDSGPHTRPGCMQPRCCDALPAGEPGRHRGPVRRRFADATALGEQTWSGPTSLRCSNRVYVAATRALLPGTTR